jgi:hypothetical protein
MHQFWSGFCLWVTSACALACTEGRPMPPPPNPNGDYLIRDEVVWVGVVADVERNVDRSWVSRKLIEFNIMDVSSPGGITPLHRVSLSNAYQVGAKSLDTHPHFELTGCSIKIPRVGERAILFITINDSRRNIVPIYESDGDLFNAWARVVSNSLPILRSAPSSPAASRTR